MDIDYLAVRFWWDIAQTLITAAIGVYVWLANRERVTTKRISALEDKVSKQMHTLSEEQDERLDRHAERLLKLETDSRHAPNQSDLGKLSGEIRKLTETVGTRLSDHDSRLARVEVACSKAPDHGSLSKVYERVNAVDSKVGDVAAQVNDQGGELRAIRKQLELINQHLLNQGK